MPLVKAEILKEVNRQNEAILGKISEINERLTPKKIQKVIDPNLFIFSKKRKKIRIRIEKVDLDIMRFFVSEPCWIDGASSFKVGTPFVHGKIQTWYAADSSGRAAEKIEIAEPSCKKFIETIFATNCVSIIFAKSSFEFIIHKSGSLSWDEVIPKVNKAILSLIS